MEGFQQAHTVTRVIRRKMPPVDRMMYSELLPEPQRKKVMFKLSVLQFYLL